jgi:hypothetical protein
MAHPGIATNNRKVVFDMSMSLDGFIRASNVSGEEDAQYSHCPQLKPLGVCSLAFPDPASLKWRNKWRKN